MYNYTYNDIHVWCKNVIDSTVYNYVCRSSSTYCIIICNYICMTNDKMTKARTKL